MYQDSKRTCTAIVLLIKPFVWWRSRCRRRRGSVNSLVIFDNLACSNSFTRFKGDQVASRSNLSLLLYLLNSFIISLIKVD